jgi:MFS transporter, UMF1 family
MYKNKSILGWAFYDWANSVFATVIIAGFFPIVFKSYWASNLTDTESTFWLGVGNAAASLFVVCLAPFLGVIGDKFNLRKPLLFAFMLLGSVTTGLFYFAHQGDWIIVLLLYIVATFGFMSANIFYDALLVSIAKINEVDKASGLGYGLGYLGGGIALAGCIYLSQNPQFLGYKNEIDAVLLCFVFVAIWWFVFSLPLMFWTRDNQQLQPLENSEPVISTTIKTFKAVFSNPQTRLFLIAYWIYIDGVDTIIRMAVDYGMALGFETSDLIQALLITQFVGFPAAIVYGYIGQRVGVKQSIMAGVGIYAVITWLGYSMSSATDFYMLAVLIGLVQGGVQAMSRSFFTRMIPQGQAAEYFGIYNMLGKSAAIIGPILMGGVALLTENHRYSILSVMLLFIVGALVLSRVKIPEDDR